MSTSFPGQDNGSPSGILQRLIRAFGFAGRGIRILVASECNARWHLVATLTVIAAGFSFGIERWEWIAILLCVGLVWTTEALNTAIEWLCDRVTTERDEQIRNIKDVAAGGVLCAAIVSVSVGFLVFVPRVIELWN